MAKTIYHLSGNNTGGTDVEATECCGIYELSGLDNKPLLIVNDVVESLNFNCNIIIFHDAMKYKEGTKFCAFLRRHKLGKVTASEIKINHNTGNLIRMWIWYPDWTAVRTIVGKIIWEKNSKFY